MSEKQIELLRVQKAMAENSRLLKEWNQYAIMSEVKIKTTEKLIEYQERLFKDRINKLKLAIDRAVNNAKLSHDTLDELVKEKEALHLELKKATHFGKVQCEHCKKYFTPQGIVRHREACASKPEIKIEKEHKEEVSEIKDALEAKKAALQKELERLESMSRKELDK